MTDVCVAQPPNFRRVWGYPPIRGQNITFIPIFLLLISHFMFETYQGLKKVGVGEMWDGGGRRGAWWVVLVHGL